MRNVKVGLIQMSLKGSTVDPPERIRKAMVDAHLPLIEEAARRGIQVLGFQELFNQPFFLCQPRSKMVFSGRADSRRANS